MNAYDDEAKIEAVKKTLGSPVFSELSDFAWGTRTSLFSVAIISIALTIADLRVDPSSTILGLRFSGLSDEIILGGLFWIILYLLCHFIWTAWDSFIEWRLRVTGTRVAFVTTGVFASRDGDYPSDPRQSTLYSWWSEEAQRIGNIGLKARDVEEKLREWESTIEMQLAGSESSVNIATACASIAQTREAVAKLGRQTHEVVKTLSSYRVPVSLQRFDNWYQLFLRSQNLRWLIIDFGAPLVAGVVALTLLWNQAV